MLGIDVIDIHFSIIKFERWSETIMHKLSTEQLLKVYKEAINLNVSKDFIILLSEEINKRLITESI
jgi:hypothetical protein